MPEASLARDVGEGAVAVVVQENVVAPEGDEQVHEAVIVVIAGADSLAPADQADAGFLRDVRESAVVIVAVEVAGGLLTLGETFQAGAIDHKNIGPAVIVEVKKSGATPGGFENVTLGLLASTFSFGDEAGAFCDVDEINFWRSERRRGDFRSWCGLQLRGCD